MNYQLMGIVIQLTPAAVLGAAMTNFTRTLKAADLTPSTPLP